MFLFAHAQKRKRNVQFLPPSPTVLQCGLYLSAVSQGSHDPRGHNVCPARPLLTFSYDVLRAD